MSDVQRRQDVTAVDLDSSSSLGYISISPSPSELALPNLAYVPPETGQVIDYDEIFGKLSFGKLVVVRESVLPFLVAVGVVVEPQLRTVCHNSNEIFADFTIEVRESCIFAVETIPADAPPMSSSRNAPVIFAEQFVMDGRLKYTLESSLAKSPNLSLLVTKSSAMKRESDAVDRELGTALAGVSVSSKMNVSAKCCISLNSILSNITVPLMKLGRHMAETSKLHTSLKARFQKDAVKSKPASEAEVGVVTLTVPVVVHVDAPIPTGGLEVGGAPIGATNVVAQVSPPGVESDSGSRIRGLGTDPAAPDAREFSSILVSFLTDLEQQTISSYGGPEKPMGGAVTPVSSVSAGSTKPRLINYSNTPKFPRGGFLISPEKTPPESQTHFLSLHTTEPHSDSSTTGATAAARRARQRSPVCKIRLQSSASNTSLTSGEVAIRIEDADSVPQVFGMSGDELDSRDVNGGDTTDSPHVVSSEDNDVLFGSSPAKSLSDTSTSRDTGTGTATTDATSSVIDSSTFAYVSDTYPLTKSLALSDGELLFTVFGLLKINSVLLGFQVETTEASLEVVGISAAVDARKASPTLKTASSVHGGTVRDGGEAKPLMTEG